MILNYFYSFAIEIQQWMQVYTRKVLPLPLSTSKFLTSDAIHFTINASIVTLTTDYNIDKSKYVRLWDSYSFATNALWLGLFIN